MSALENLIPRPRKAEALDAPAVRVDSTWRVCRPSGHPGLAGVADRVAGWLARALGGGDGSVFLQDSESVPGIVFQITSQVQGQEAYELTARDGKIVIAAGSPDGLSRGVATLEQLGPENGARRNSFELPAVRIADHPLHAWRGMHLDCARHFLTPDFLRKFIDAMSLYKFNRLHLHLADDQGWRVEIRAFPRLTDIGAWRDGTLIGHVLEEPHPYEFTPGPYGGYYRQDELRALAAYAAERGIDVIPEIEMPGHCSAAIAAYPELSCRREPIAVPRIWGQFRHQMCAGSETVLEMMDAVLAEVAEIFPSPYLHLGGDECTSTYWKRCPACQERKRAEGLETEKDLHAWFLRRMASSAAALGKIPMAWDEVLDGGISIPGMVVSSWRGESHTVTAARRGNPLINCDLNFTYFDHYQSPGRAGEPRAWGGCTPLEKTYAFEPIPAALTGPEAAQVLGAQGQLWSEYLPTAWHVEYAAFPRMLALAEKLWHGGRTEDWPEFAARLPSHLSLLADRGINARKPGGGSTIPPPPQ